MWNLAVSHWLVLFAAVCLPWCGGCRFTSQGQNQVGVQQFNGGNPAAAAASFQQALQMNPRSPDAYYNLGALYHRYATQQNNREYFTAAENYYKQCLTLEPNHLDGHRGYAVLLAETTRADQAFGMLKSWVATYPNSAEPKVELARLYQEYGDKQTAEAFLTQALQTDPNSARAYAALGKLREDANDLSAALAHYQRAYQLNPSQPEVYQRMADLGRRGVNPAPTIAPAAPGYNPGTRMVNAPGPMRRF